MTIQRNSKKKHAATVTISGHRLNLILLLSLVQVILLAWFIWFSVTGGSSLRDAVSTGSTADYRAAVETSSQPVAEVIDSGDSAPTIAQEAELTGAPSTLAGEESLPPMLTPVRVEVLNGTGVRKLAWRFSQRLIENGVDVRETTNADRNNYNQTRIICRSADIRQGYHLAQLLNLSTARVEQISAPRLVDIDVTLIIGADYQQIQL